MMSSCVLTQERDDACDSVKRVLTALENNERVEKLPSALFERLLASLFKRDEFNSTESVFSMCELSNDPMILSLFNRARTYESHRCLVRFLIRTFADSVFALPKGSVADQVGSDFFLATADQCYHDTGIASTWLQACSAVAEDPSRHPWLFSTGCVTRICSFVKNQNMYICRSAASTLCILLQRSCCHPTYNETNIEHAKDLITILLGNVIQFASAGNLSNIAKSNVPDISENCALESARVIVEFSESMHKLGFDTSSIRNTLGISLSNEESVMLLQIGLKYKRMQDWGVAVYCALSDNDIDMQFSNDSLSARVALRRLKILSTLNCSTSTVQNSNSYWHLVLQQVLSFSCSKDGRCISSLSTFLRGLSTAENFSASLLKEGAPEVLKSCADMLGALKYIKLFDIDISPCLNLVSTSCSIFSKLDTTTLRLTVDSGVLSRTVDLLEVFLPKGNKLLSDSVLAELLRTVACSLKDIWFGYHTFREEVHDAVLSETERFLKLCTIIEGSTELKAVASFACIEAVLKLTTIFGMLDNELAKGDRFIGLSAAIKGWAPAVVNVLNRFVSSNINFEDLVSAYGHSSRFTALSRLTSLKFFVNDAAYLSKLIESLPIEKLSPLTSLAFPAVRRSVFYYLFVVSHLRALFGVASNSSGAMLISLRESVCDEPDPVVAGLLKSWSLECCNHTTDANWRECDTLKTLLLDSSSKKDDLEMSADSVNDRLTTAIRICKDVLAFLHSPDDLPCVFIGAAEDGDQDNLDCEES